MAEAGICDVVGREPTPEFAALFGEEVERRLNQLDDDTLKAVALAKMEDLPNTEIAQRLGLTDRTIRRKLKVIATIWEHSP